MGSVDWVVLAAVRGAAEVLPISATGHGAVLQLWLDGGRSAASLEGPVALATAAALAPARDGGDGAAAVVAFFGAVLAVEALRALSERRRTGTLALWVVPLGLATVAYARALPGLA